MIDGNGSGQAVAACPGGTKITGGGFDGDASLTITGMSVQANGWQVSAKNNSRSPLQLTARALCVANLSGPITQATAQATVQPGATGSVTAPCAGGSVLTGGGFGSTTQQEVLSSVNSGNGWQAAARNIGTLPQPLTAYAVCYGSAGASSTVVSKQGSVGANGSATVSADCPGDKLVSGGGYSVPSGLVVTSSARNNNSWQVSAANALTTTQTLTAVVVCSGF